MYKNIVSVNQFTMWRLWFSHAEVLPVFLPGSQMLSQHQASELNSSHCQQAHDILVLLISTSF